MKSTARTRNALISLGIAGIAAALLAIGALAPARTEAQVAAPTATATATATRTASPTPSRTPTANPSTRTATATTTASPSRTATAAPVATSTGVPVPTATRAAGGVSPTTKLPKTGDGSHGNGDGRLWFASAMMTLTGAGMLGFVVRFGRPKR